jgi:hypothetical protein
MCYYQFFSKMIEYALRYSYTEKNNRKSGRCRFKRQMRCASWSAKQHEERM